MNRNVLFGLMKGFQASQDRQMKIGAARDKQRMDQERLDLQKKTLNLRKQELESKGKMNPTIKAMIDVELAKTKGGQDILTATRAKSNQLYSDTEMEQKQILNMAQKLSFLESIGQATVREGGDGGVNVGFTNPKSGTDKATADDEARGMIESKAMLNKGELVPINDRGKMEKVLNLKYSNWKKNKNLVELFEKQYGEKHEVDKVYNFPGKGDWKFLGDGKFEEVLK